MVLAEETVFFAEMIQRIFCARFGREDTAGSSFAAVGAVVAERCFGFERGDEKHFPRVEFDFRLAFFQDMPGEFFPLVFVNCLTDKGFFATGMLIEPPFERLGRLPDVHLAVDRVDDEIYDSEWFH